MGRPVGEEGREMILQIQQGLAAEGFAVSISKLCSYCCEWIVTVICHKANFLRCLPNFKCNTNALYNA
jgi:hypothetical protein